MHDIDLPRHTPWACVTYLSTFFSRSHARTFDSHASGSQACFFVKLSLLVHFWTLKINIKLFKKYEYHQSQSQICVKLWPYELSVPCSFLAQPVPFLLGDRLLCLNGHLNLKWGHNLDSTCPYLAPNHRKLPFLGVKFWTFSRGAFPCTPIADPGAAGGPCHPFRIFFFLTETKSTRKKKLVNIKLVRNLSQNAGNGHLETQIFKYFWGSLPSGPPENACLWCSLSPTPPPPHPKKSPAPLEISHTQQFFNLGISDDIMVQAVQGLQKHKI